jgi:outer membrane protein assembly factor BamE (lipoprotein component of BamABCDE complex)
MSIKVIKLVLVLILVSCQHNTTHGNQRLEQSTLDHLKTSKASQEEVLNQIGSPAFTSDYHPKAWYYLTIKQHRSAFLPPRIKNEELVQISFDSNGRVAEIIKNTNVLKDVVFSNDVTRSGKGDGELELMLKNTSRFNKPHKKSGGKS